MKYPIGIQNFEKIREGGYLYIDKTDLIYDLVNNGVYYFLSRPRRFGKSLLISTLETYFSGKREMFEGLKIAELEKEWTEYPVLHLDLNTKRYENKASLLEILNMHLEMWEAEYGDEKKDRSPEERFMYVIGRAYEKTGKQVVILVDEYDKPMLQAIDNEELQDEYRSTLKAFYGALKSMDRYIRFAKDGIKDLGTANDMTEEETKAKLKELYDGYHFNEDCVDIYNLSGLMITLDSKQLMSNWIEVGTPSFLVKMLKKRDSDFGDLEGVEIDGSLLDSNDTASKNLIPLIYQSGYLTIKAYDKKSNTYKLGFPNEHVKNAFTVLMNSF